jgi:hypothetical protein
MFAARHAPATHGKLNSRDLHVPGHPAAGFEGFVNHIGR